RSPPLPYTTLFRSVEPAARVVLGDARRDRLARDHLRASRQEPAIAARVGWRTRLLAGDALIAELLDREDGHLGLIFGVAAPGLDIHLPLVRRVLVYVIEERSVRFSRASVTVLDDVRHGLL